MWGKIKNWNRQQIYILEKRRVCVGLKALRRSGWSEACFVNTSWLSRFGGGRSRWMEGEAHSTVLPVLFLVLYQLGLEETTLLTPKVKNGLISLIALFYDSTFFLLYPLHKRIFIHFYLFRKLIFFSCYIDMKCLSSLLGYWDKSIMKCKEQYCFFFLLLSSVQILFISIIICRQNKVIATSQRAINTSVIRKDMRITRYAWVCNLASYKDK